MDNSEQPATPPWAGAPQAAALFALVTATLAMAGWAFDLLWLTAVHPRLVAIKLNTAIGFLLCGIALAVAGRDAWRHGQRSLAAARAAATLALLLGLATLVEHAGYDLGIDNLIVTEAPGAVGTLSPGRMAPSSAVCFVLLGLALLLELRNRSAVGLAQALALVPLLPAALALLAGIYDLSSRYGLAYYNQMALPTIAAFIALSLGILSLHRDRGLPYLFACSGPTRIILTSLLPATMILPSLLGWLTLDGSRLGLFDPEFGLLLMVTTGTLLASAMVIWVARSLDLVERERQRMREELEDSEAKFHGITTAAIESGKALLQSVIDAVPEWIYVKSTDGRLTLVNRAFASACRARPENMVGRPAANFAPVAFIEQEPPASLGEERNDADAIFDADNASLVRLPLATGASRVFAVFKAALDQAGRDRGEILCYCRDVTDQRQAMAERLALVAKLGRAQKMETIGMLSGGIAHDFNNILAAVIGYAELGLILEGNNAGSAQRKIVTYLSGILQAANRAKALVRQLLNFSRAKEAGEIDEALVGPVVKEVVGLLGSTLPASIALEAQVAANLPPVQFGPVKLHQVLMNLCINARDALAGRGRIAIRAYAVALDHACDCDSCHHGFSGDYVVVSVKDNGPGIALSERSHIFSPFFTTKDVGEGTGLGLSVLHGLVHAADGHIKLISEIGVGSEFLIHLPLLATPPPATAAETEAKVRGAARRASILVVDDEAAVAGIVAELLGQAGHSVTALAHAGDALALFQAEPLRFDLVITDQTMPGMTGDELARALLAIRPQLPIILCSGHSSFGEEEARQLGVRHLLAKPVDGAGLRAAVAACLD